MSPVLLGALIGLAFAVAEYFVFGVLINRSRARGETSGGIVVLDWLRKIQLVGFPILGAIAGPFLLRSYGG